MKKFFNFVISAIVAMGLFVLFIYTYNKVLDKKIDSLYKDTTYISYGTTEKNQGLVLQKMGISKQNFMIYGSSELGANVPQNPTRFFPNQNNDFIVNAVGRGYVQSLQHAMNLGALSKELKGKKIAFVVSLQWFMGKEGVAAESFQMNFSELQYIKTMNNSDLARGSKEYISKRVYDMLGTDTKYKDVRKYAELYSRNTKLNDIELMLFKPYFLLKEQVLTIKDKTTAIEYLKSKKNGEINPSKLKKVDWAEEEKSAEEMGKKASSSNKYHIEDNYYNKYVKDNIDKAKGTYSNINLDGSLENSDFNELIKLCKQLEIKPYFIIMPVNGPYYDDLGISKEMRDSYYNRVENIAHINGFNVLNLAEEDYEPYFMVDSMHLGWRGWLYIDEKIAEYYNKN